MKRLSLVSLILMCVPFSSSAWNYQGHTTVAAIAYGSMTANERQAVDAVLQHHPWYVKWQQEHQQAGPSIGVAFPQYAAMRAATWPDDIRDIPAYHRGTWHYVNFPLTPPNSLDTTASIGGDLITQIEAALAVVATHPTTASKRGAVPLH